jgi:hypothetical protein
VATVITDDSTIHTLKGNRFARQLADGEPFYVFTWAEDRISVGRARLRLTKKPARLVRVVLDDGTSLRVSGDADLVLRDGQRVSADALLADTSLMPLYLRERRRYPCYRQMGTHYKAAPAHCDRERTRHIARMVAEWKFERQLVHGDYVRHNDGDRHNCVAEGQRVHLIDSSTVSSLPIEFLAGVPGQVLAYDPKRKRIAKVAPINPRMTCNESEVIELSFGPKQLLRVTPDHRVLTPERDYVEAGKLRKGDRVVSMFAGFNPDVATFLVEPRAGTRTLEADPGDGGVARVFDLTTRAKNFVIEGVVVHNCTPENLRLEGKPGSKRRGRSPFKKLRATLGLPTSPGNHKVVGVAPFDESDGYEIIGEGASNCAVNGVFIGIEQVTRGST